MPTAAGDTQDVNMLIIVLEDDDVVTEIRCPDRFAPFGAKPEPKRILRDGFDECAQAVYELPRLIGVVIGNVIADRTDIGGRILGIHKDQLACSLAFRAAISSIR